jgi:EAL domain-containing protein (putative c-di-GMP-specific phosphodiesterase class I)
VFLRRSKLLSRLSQTKLHRPHAGIWPGAIALLAASIIDALLFTIGAWLVAALCTLALMAASNAVVIFLALRLKKADLRADEAVDVMQRYRELQRALEEGEFRLYYQPEVSFKTGAIEGLEALVRWRTADGAIVPPADFIPFAESSGLIRPLGTWILREACNQLATWRETLPEAANLRVSVNVSGVQLDDPKFVSVVHMALRDSGLDPDGLILEITETSLISDPKIFRVSLPQLRELGVHFAIDDFGTGYASMNYLQSFKFDYVKLEERFITPIDVGEGDVDLIAGLVSLTKSLGASVVAEGVRTARQAYVCGMVGCDWGQGYYFSEPRAAEEIEALLTSPHAIIAA